MLVEASTCNLFNPGRLMNPNTHLVREPAIVHVQRAWYYMYDGTQKRDKKYVINVTESSVPDIG